MNFFHIKYFLVICTTDFYKKLWNWKSRKNCEKFFRKKFKNIMWEQLKLSKVFQIEKKNSSNCPPPYPQFWLMVSKIFFFSCSWLHVCESPQTQKQQENMVSMFFKRKTVRKCALNFFKLKNSLKTCFSTFFKRKNSHKTCFQILWK